MHSSRMRTARFSDHLSCTHAHPLPCTLPAMHAPCYTCMPPCHACPLPCTPSATPPMNRIRDRCKNIIFPQLRLRAVKIMLPAVRTELGTLCLLAWCSPIWANLALLVRLRLLRSIYNHVLLILAKFKSE